MALVKLSKWAATSCPYFNNPVKVVPSRWAFDRSDEAVPTDINSMIKARITLNPYLLLMFAGLLMVTTQVVAHGGVSLEDDLCIMRIGQYRAHFTGYQPQARASQEFCEDIPELGEAIIVLDFLDPALRDMDIEFEVIADPSGKGAKAQLADIEQALESGTHRLHRTTSARYPGGSFNVNLSISEPGWYVGILTAVASDREVSEISVFPFSVGVRDYSSVIKWVIGILVLSLIFYLLSARRRPAED